VVFELTPPALAARRTARKSPRRDPDPHFLPDTSRQLDAVLGCPALTVPGEHLAWAVLKVVERLDTSAVEAKYSSLGRRGYHPKSTLAIWVYASLVGLHHSTKVARAIETDAAFRLLGRGGKHSGATLRRFRKDNAELFTAAIEQTVALARADGRIDERDLAADSVRLRAHASTKAVRTRKRSMERLRELAAVALDQLDSEGRAAHQAKVRKHAEALALCDERDTSSVVLTSPSAALMKFPSGAGLPGHRATVIASGQASRFVVGVLIDADTNDYGKLESAVAETRRVLERAGLPPEAQLQIAADAGYWSEADLIFAAEADDVDVLIADPRAEPATTLRFFGRDRFTIHDDRTATCPAGRTMYGPYDDVTAGRTKWLGDGCEACPLRSQCTDGRRRTLTASTAAEAMRVRLKAHGARARYNRRMATVEPVFSSLEDAMGYRRVSTRHEGAVRGEILLKILAYNVSRLIQTGRLRPVFFLVGPF
jgi:transposase